MTIPNSFSLNDLEKAYNSAPKEEEQAASKASYDVEAYQAQILEVAQRHCANAFDELQDPVLHKAMACIILRNLVSYHERKATSAVEQSEAQVAGLWMRDAGQLLAALKTLSDVSVSDQDFFAGE